MSSGSGTNGDCCKEAWGRRTPSTGLTGSGTTAPKSSWGGKAASFGAGGGISSFFGNQACCGDSDGVA